MADLDLDNLSPEDKAMFDAMVAEEMRKLEEQFQQEASMEAAAEERGGGGGGGGGGGRGGREAPPSYVPSQPQRYDQEPRDNSSSHFEHDFGNRRDRDQGYGQGPGPGQGVPRGRRDDSSLNPDRLAYKSPEWNNEDQILVGKGGRAMGVGRHETKEEKRRKQQEYAAQLNDGIAAQKVCFISFFMIS